MSKPEERALIGERLREARKLAGLSQGQSAKMIGLHRPTITEIEAGNRKVSAEEIKQFSNLYDVSVSWLLGDVDESIASNDPRVQLAARELAKIGSDDLEKMLRLISAMRDK